MWEKQTSRQWACMNASECKSIITIMNWTIDTEKQKNIRRSPTSASQLMFVDIITCLFGLWTGISEVETYRQWRELFTVLVQCKHLQKMWLAIESPQYFSLTSFLFLLPTAWVAQKSNIFSKKKQASNRKSKFNCRKAVTAYKFTVINFCNFIQTFAW